MINTDSWTERWPDHPVIRTFNPARIVQVDMSKALPLGRGAGRADRVSLRAKSSSVYLSGMLTARQTHWIQIHDSQWLACRHGLKLTIDRQSWVTRIDLSAANTSFSGVAPVPADRHGAHRQSGTVSALSVSRAHPTVAV